MKKSNKSFYLLLFMTNVSGAIYNIIMSFNSIKQSTYSVILISFALFFISLFCLHFNYAMCKWSLYSKVRNWENVEPSEINLAISKFFGWFMYSISVLILFVQL